MALDLTQRLRVGTTNVQHLTVASEHTAPHVGSGTAPVLATPVLVNLFEAAALAAIENRLPQGMQSLGTRLDIQHTAATPVGMSVRAEARLSKIDGRILLFELTAHDEQEEIGGGSHTRMVVDIARFDQRVQKKSVLSASTKQT
ncbi:MAG: thioesterase family protein [Granulosicoccus sp.]|nr:thioesterase family protein [Granulosicoccus sp.]